MRSRMPTPQELLEQLRQVKYPGFTRDIVSFGMVKDIQVGSRGVTVELAGVAAGAAGTGAGPPGLAPAVRPCSAGTT